MGTRLSLADAQALPPGHRLRSWAYNALDVTGTREIADVLLPRMTPAVQRTYDFERAQQNPAFSMMNMGVRVDMEKRKSLIKQAEKDLGFQERLVSKMKGVSDVWDGMEKETGFCPMGSIEKPQRHKWEKGVPDGPDRKCERCGTSRMKIKPFEPNSTHQVKHLLYDIHKIPPLRNKKQEISVDDDVLLRIKHKHADKAHIIEAIQEVRDKVKQLGTLNARLSKDNRYMSSFNVGAAWTGRFSSSKNPFGEGGNAQNLGEQHRIQFQADYGWDMAYADLKQAESNVVAHVAGDEKYIEAHKSGDVHTYVTRLVWPDLPWTGDLKQDKKIAKQNPVWDPAPGHDFRFQAKRIQHGSNFGLTPPGIAMIAKIPVAEARKAQHNYFTEFDGIPAWQDSIKAKIRNHEPLTNLLGRTMYFFGRPDDPHTHKQGLAFIPQSTVADILDLAMLRIFLEMDPWEVQLLAQVHDALLLQFLSGRMDIIKRVMNLMMIPVPVNGRIMVIEPEVAVGKNWGHKSEANPHGIEEIIL